MKNNIVKVILLVTYVISLIRVCISPAPLVQLALSGDRDQLAVCGRDMSETNVTVPIL